MNMLEAARQSLAKMWSNHLRYEQIYSELREMNQRELAELGLHRDDAARIALDTVRAERARTVQPATRSHPTRGLVRA